MTSPTLDEIFDLLPQGFDRYDFYKTQDLKRIRNHINALEAQQYCLFLLHILDEKPEVESIVLGNQDNPSDNGRHISIYPGGTLLEGKEYEALEQWLEDKADWINNTLRHRGIYDYLDNLIAVDELHRDSAEAQLEAVFDQTFEEEGLWAKFKAAGQASLLSSQTPVSKPAKRSSKL